MTPTQRNNDVYNHPQSEEEVNQQAGLEQGDSSIKTAVNPNPRANENVPTNTSPDENAASRAGSEVTDGEDG
jgi:hypothetical protein